MCSCFSLDSSFSNRLLHALSSPDSSSLLAELASSVSSGGGPLLRERESEVLDKLGAEEEEILRYLIDLEETAEEEEEGEDLPVRKKVGKEEGSNGKEGLKLRNHQHQHHRNKQGEEEEVVATTAMTTAALETRHTTNKPYSK